MPRAWLHARGALPLGPRTLVMGVVNATPDSFSDGGRFAEAGAAIAAGRAMAAEGADLLDVGGESTRPGHAPVAGEEEIARVRPVIEALARDGVPMSVDTSKAPVARAALDAGAAIVNDVWGFRRDPEIAAVAAHAGAGAVLMHNREATDPALDIAEDILRVLAASAGIARRAGVAEGAIVLDPGLGFGKTPAQNLQALAAVPRLARELGYPVLVGASRKSFIARLLDPAPPVGERLPGTLAAHLGAVLAGAAIVRVHDVAAHVQALRVAEAVRDAAP